jgi:hypothetical protein
MVIKGRSRSNGVQLADYLLQSKENDRARIIDIRGTAQPDDLKRSLREMSLSSELTKRGKLGLYHAQVNPAIGEDRPMTHDDWLRAADVLEQSLGYEGQKRAIVLHEKNGRVHGHIVWERYDHDTGKIRSDSHNFKKHDQARAQIEQELGHDRTPQRAEKEPTHKERLTDLWQQHPDGRSFIEAAEEAGYYIAQKDDRRPFRAITPEGNSVDLVRQLDGIKTKEVRDRLQPIRADLWEEVEALKLSKADRDRAAKRDQPEPEQSDKTDDLSDSQDRAEALKAQYKEQVKEQQERPAQDAPAPENDRPPSPPREPESSDLQDTAAAMLQAYRQRQVEQQERQRKAREMQQQAKEQTKKQRESYSITDEAAEMLKRYRQQQRDQGHDRDEPEL